jgi:hypothetical protein
VNTERLPDVPRQEPGDFYYHLLRLPYNAPAAPGELPFEPDPTIEDVMDFSSDSGDQLGFVIVREKDTVDIVDTLGGQHIRFSFGNAEESASGHVGAAIESLQQQQLLEALQQVSISEK